MHLLVVFVFLGLGQGKGALVVHGGLLRKLAHLLGEQNVPVLLHHICSQILLLLCRHRCCVDHHGFIDFNNDFIGLSWDLPCQEHVDGRLHIFSILKIDRFDLLLLVLPGHQLEDLLNVVFICWVQRWTSLRTFSLLLFLTLRLGLGLPTNFGHVDSLTARERLKDDQTHLLVFIIKEPLFESVNGTDQVTTVLVIFFVIQELLQELLARIVLAQVVLVPVQAVLCQLDVSGDPENELLQTLADPVLDHCEVFAKHADTLNDRHVQQSDARLDRQLLQGPPDNLEFTLVVRTFEPMCLGRPSH